MIPITLLGFLVCSLLIVIWGSVLAEKRRVRKATSIIAMVVLPALLWRPMHWTTDCIHLALTAGFGLGQLGSTSVPNGTRFEAFDWSVGLVGGWTTFLIFDPTDEIALPMAQHTHSPESELGFGPDCAGNVSHLVFHYYVCTF